MEDVYKRQPLHCLINLRYSFDFHWHSAGRRIHTWTKGVFTMVTFASSIRFYILIFRVTCYRGFNSTPQNLIILNRKLKTL